jgi:hypothetical protein
MIKKTHGYTDNELQLSCGPCCVGLFFLTGYMGVCLSRIY